MVAAERIQKFFEAKLFSQCVTGVSCLQSCLWFLWTAISRDDWYWRGIQYGGIEVTSLLFVDVLLAPSGVDPRHALEQFTVECVAAGMKIKGHGSLLKKSGTPPSGEGRDFPPVWGV